MTHAFSAFGNDGQLGEVHLVTRVEGPDGAVLWEQEHSEARRVLDRATAYVVLDAMTAVVDRGTGRSVRGYGYRGPAAGKTGTTNDGKDAWFVGLTPDLVAGVWIGFDQPLPIVEDRGGGALAAPVYGMWMRSLQGTLPNRRAWVPPPTVARVRYSPETGEVFSPVCRSLGEEVTHEAWVVEGQYDRSACPRRRGIRGLLDRFWRGSAPQVRTIRAVEIGSRGGELRRRNR